MDRNDVKTPASDQLKSQSKTQHRKDLESMYGGQSDEGTTQTQADNTSQQQQGTGQSGQPTQQSSADSNPYQRTENQPQDSQQGQSQQGLDNQQNNSDNTGVQSQSSQQTGDSNDQSSDEQRFRRIYEQQFKGDPVKATKSWSEMQRMYTQAQNEKSEVQNDLNFFLGVLEKNPDLKQRIFQAAQGQGNADTQAPEPQGQPQQPQQQRQSYQNQPVQQQQQPASNGQQGLTEDFLIQKGYIDGNKKTSVSPSEWTQEVANAQYRYMTSPEFYQQQAQQIAQHQQQQQQQSQYQQELQKLNDTNRERFSKGYDKAVDELNINFADNPSMFEDIKKRMVGFRDPNDTRLYHPDAFYLAAREVVETSGGQQHSPATPQQQSSTQRKYDPMFDTGFNRNKTGAVTPKNVQAEPTQANPWDAIDAKHKDKSLRGIQRFENVRTGERREVRKI